MSEKFRTEGTVKAIVEPPRMESTVASEYRLVKRKRLIPIEVEIARVEYEYVLQGKFNWTKGFAGGFEWRDISTVEE